MNRKSHDLVAAGGLALALASTPVWAQAYPAKPVKIVMTVAGGANTAMRIVAQRLTATLGQGFIVEAQSGAGGAIGQEAVARAEPDGYTLMASSVSSHVANGFLSKNARYDPVKSYTPIGKLFESILLIVSNTSLPVTSMGELIEYAKKNPGKVSYGTSGIGTTHHFSAVMIDALTGIDWVHVPYKGGPPVITDLLGGRIQVGFTILGTIRSFQIGDKIRILGVNNDKRTSLLPGMLTVSEQLPGYEAPPTWVAMFGPAGLAQPIVRRLHPEIMKIMAEAEVRAKIEGMGFVISTTTPEELAENVRRDIVTIGRAVKQAGIKPE